jgi:hypothetical protein
MNKRAIATKAMAQTAGAALIVLTCALAAEPPADTGEMVDVPAGPASSQRPQAASSVSGVSANSRLLKAGILGFWRSGMGKSQ